MTRYKVGRAFVDFGMYHDIGEIISDVSFVDNLVVKMWDGTLIPIDEEGEVVPTRTKETEEAEAAAKVAEEAEAAKAAAAAKTETPKSPETPVTPPKATVVAATTTVKTATKVATASKK